MILYCATCMCMQRFSVNGCSCDVNRLIYPASPIITPRWLIPTWMRHMSWWLPCPFGTGDAELRIFKRNDYQKNTRIPKFEGESSHNCFMECNKLSDDIGIRTCIIRCEIFKTNFLWSIRGAYTLNDLLKSKMEHIGEESLKGTAWWKFC